MQRTLIFGSALAVIAAVGIFTVPATAATKPIRLPDIARATAAARTFQFSMTTLVSFSTSADDEPIGGKITASGSVDNSRPAAATEMDVSDYVKALTTVQGRPLPKDLSDPALFKIRVVTLGSNLWVNLPMLNRTASQGSSKPWTAIDTTTIDVAAGDVLAAQGADPGDGIRFVQGLPATATEAGKERVRGVDTTRYNGTIELDRLLKNVSGDDAAAARRAFGNKKSLPMSVWVDSDARARRLDVTVESDTIEATGGSSVHLVTIESYEYFAFDESAIIASPPSSQVGENAAVRAAVARIASTKKPA
jgi:hypothetical protein